MGSSKDDRESSASIATTTSATTTTTTPNSSTNTPKVAANSETDKYKKFENDGVVFKAKLIGSELVMEPRGDKMCQNSIQRLKAIIKGTNSHKKRIVLKISYDGVKVFDEKTNEILHRHEVSQISYIASDETDNRSFGYVSDVPNKAHQFICFKTSGPAINVMSVLSALFEAVQEKTKQAEKAKEATGSLIKPNDFFKEDPAHKKHQDSIDLIGGDSGILDVDASLISDDKSHLPPFHPLPQLQHQASSVLLDSSMASPSNSFSSTGNMTDRGKQSAGSDLIFSDLFSGLSDPIIVDKNDSLISYKPEFNTTAHQALSGSMGGGVSLGGSGAGAGSGLAGGLASSSGGGVPFNIPPPQRSASMAANASARPIPRRQNSTQQHHSAAVLPPPSSLPRPAPMMSSSGPASHNRSLVYNHSSVSLSDAALTHQSSFNSTTSSATQNDSYVDRYAVFNDINNLPSIFESTSLGSVNNINSGGNTNINNNNNNTRLGSSLLQPTLSSSGLTGSTSMMMMGAPPQASSSLNAASMMPSNSYGNSNALSSSNNSSSIKMSQPCMFRQTNPFDDDFFA